MRARAKTSIGLPVRLLHYGLLAVLSLTIVGALKAVGIDRAPRLAALGAGGHAGQQSRAQQVQHPGQQLAPREVSGGTEQDNGCGPFRHGTQSVARA